MAGPPIASSQTDCPFCHKSFGRADVSRRHARSCPARKGRDLPPVAKRGRKHRACDNCASVKLSCNATLPCRRCAARSIECVYSALCQDASHKSTVEERPKDDRKGLTFLLKASNPSHTSLDVNVAAEPERTSEEPTWRHQGQLDSGTVDPKFLFLNLSDMLLDEPMDYEKPGDEFQFYNILDTPATAADTLTTRIATLSSDLQGMVTNKPQLKEGLEHTDQRGFFTPSHFHNAFIALFRRRYYHMPPIHWPTFHLDDIAPHLLLAVILTGTAYLQYLDQSFQHFLTASLLELAEKYIFKELKRLTDQNITPLTSKHMLEICQAAVLMHSLEGSTNHAEARRRIASKRIPTLLAVLRKTGIVGLEHPQGEVSWEGFIHRETCIRVVSWTFTNDSLMSLFCNHPPAMTVKEMVGHFPCSSELWDADSSDAFRKHMHTVTRTYPSSCHEAVSGLLSNEWASRNKSFVGLDTSDLFLINIGRLIFPS